MSWENAIENYLQNDLHFDQAAMGQRRVQDC